MWASISFFYCTINVWYNVSTCIHADNVYTPRNFKCHLITRIIEHIHVYTPSLDSRSLESRLVYTIIIPIIISPFLFSSTYMHMQATIGGSDAFCSDSDCKTFFSDAYNNCGLCNPIELGMTYTCMHIHMPWYTCMITQSSYIYT